MNARTPSQTSRAALWLAAGLALVAGGCMLDAGGKASADVDLGDDAVITGTLQGDAAASSMAKSASTMSDADWEGTLVTTHEVDAEGEAGPAVDSANASADGSFEIRTRLRGERALLIRAIRHGIEWKARLEDRIESGKERAIGAIDLASSVDAEVWLELRREGKARSVLAAEIRAAVEAARDSGTLADFRADAVARAALVTRIKEAVRARAEARAEAVAELAERTEAEADSSERVRPRPVLKPCERAALVLSVMDTTDSAYASLKATFTAHCLEAPDRNAPQLPRPACEDAKARLETMDPESPEYERLRVRVAIRCDLLPPPHPLTPCERAAIRLAAMSTTHPAYATLRARFETHCMEGDGSGEETAPEGDSFLNASADAEVELEAALRGDSVSGALRGSGGARIDG